MEKKQESHKHHFVPQFILKNFADDEKQLYHWDNVERKLEKKSVSEVFMDNDMYRDEKQSAENPTAIEDDFSVFERRIAMLMQNKIFNKSEIRITKKENEELIIFFTLLSFRSGYRKKQYLDGDFDEETKRILLYYQPDGDFELLWKRELNTIVKLRNYGKMMKKENLDNIIKNEFLNDYKGYYMTFIETHDEEFLITDVNPTLAYIPNIDFPVQCYYPLSPHRMIVLNSIVLKEDCLDKKYRDYLLNKTKIGSELLKAPNMNKLSENDNNDKDQLIYEMVKCSNEQVRTINSLLLNEARKEMTFLNYDLIKYSLYNYQCIIGKKNNYEKLIEQIEQKNKKSVDN